MRLAFPEQPRLDCPPVDAVPLNLNCRDEIIPILRALQHVYGQAPLRREILDLVGKDVNRDSSPDHGREGLELLDDHGAGGGSAGLQLRLRQTARPGGATPHLAVDDGHRRLGGRRRTLIGGGFGTTCACCGRKRWRRSTT